MLPGHKLVVMARIFLQDYPPVRCRYCCSHVLHHSPGSPRYTFASVEPNQKEYVGYYRLTIESTVSSLAERRGKVT